VVKTVCYTKVELEVILLYPQIKVSVLPVQCCYTNEGVTDALFFIIVSPFGGCGDCQDV